MLTVFILIIKVTKCSLLLNLNQIKYILCCSNLFDIEVLNHLIVVIKFLKLCDTVFVFRYTIYAIFRLAI